MPPVLPCRAFHPQGAVRETSEKNNYSLCPPVQRTSLLRAVFAEHLKNIEQIEHDFAAEGTQRHGKEARCEKGSRKGQQRSCIPPPCASLEKLELRLATLVSPRHSCVAPIPSRCSTRQQRTSAPPSESAKCRAPHRRPYHTSANWRDCRVAANRPSTPSRTPLINAPAPPE